MITLAYWKVDNPRGLRFSWSFPEGTEISNSEGEWGPIGKFTAPTRLSFKSVPSMTPKEAYAYLKLNTHHDYGLVMWGECSTLFPKILEDQGKIRVIFLQGPHRNLLGYDTGEATPEWVIKAKTVPEEVRGWHKEPSVWNLILLDPYQDILG